MHAYVFWHWKRTDVPSSDYENRLIQFHRALGKTPSEGFKDSWSAALQNAPWANSGRDAYEDWYWIENSAALDPLNDAAVSASRKAPHDQAAMAVKDGAAGLYYLRAGKEFTAPQFAMWFAKPKDWSYKQLTDELRPYIVGDVALWTRQMALGPAREFCVHANEQLKLPAGIEAQTIPLRAVFPESA